MKKKMIWAGLFLALFFAMLPMAQMVVAHAEVHGVMNTDGSFTADVVDPAPAIAVTSAATVPAGSPVAIPVTSTEGGHWWSGLLSTVLAAVLAGLTALITWMSNNLKTWIQQKASEQSTKESAAWYATALYLARIGIGYAKDKVGPDSTKGTEIKLEALKWLKARLAALDKDILDPRKNPNIDDTLMGFIGAAYSLPFEAVSPLQTAPALKQA